IKKANNSHSKKILDNYAQSEINLARAKMTKFLERRRKVRMKIKTRLVGLLGLGLSLFWALPSYAQTNPLWISNIGGGVKAVLYKPDNNPNSKVGVIVIHRTSNYLNHAACTQLSSRGLTVLCMNSRFDNNEALVDWELIAQDVGRGVNYLRNTVKVN